MLHIVPIGGRIKSASIGLNRFYSGQTGAELNETISRLRRSPCEDLRRAFFPRVGKELRHMTSGIGLYRPSLKTDQGMPGNFLPFGIDMKVKETNLDIRHIAAEEGIAIPETWSAGNNLERAVQRAFLHFDLETTYELLQHLGTRRAEKGRLPFMFIRPAMPEHPFVFGADTVERVMGEINRVFAQCVTRAQAREHEQTGNVHTPNALYVQPDVFVLADGTIKIERFNCPDVGFFLASLGIDGARILPQIGMTMKSILKCVVNKIASQMGERITIVTRDEVIGQQEDVLELLEISMLQSALTLAGAVVDVIPVSAVNSVDTGTRLLLLNLDYRSESTAALLKRHASGEVDCFPNPYLQITCNEFSGLDELTIDRASKHGRLLLERASSNPGSEAGIEEAIRLIDQSLHRGGIESDILHVVLETETVPVFRSALHSWRQFVTRAGRLQNEKGAIRIRGVPAHPDNILLTSSTGPRLHAFRFMCTA